MNSQCKKCKQPCKQEAFIQILVCKDFTPKNAPKAKDEKQGRLSSFEKHLRQIE